MRFSKTSAHVVSVSAVVLGLVACTAAQMTPTWEKWFSLNEQQERYETIHQVIYDPAGAVISVGSSSYTGSANDELVVFKTATNGTLLWKSSTDLDVYDRPWHSVLGSDGSIYAVTESSIVKFNSNGVKQWQRNISTLIGADAMIRDVEISNNQVYQNRRKTSCL